MENNFRVCRDCYITHYENCPMCFGFGHWKGGRIIHALTAYEMSMDINHPKRDDAVPCPLCGSTFNGIPWRNDGERVS